MAKKVIYLVAERTGETLAKLAAAALSQFDADEVEVRHFSLVEDRALLLSIISRARQDEALIAYTIVDSDQRAFLEHEAGRRGVDTVDVLGNFIVRLALFLGQEPLRIPGKQHQVDADYYRRIEAIEFSVRHDDGQSLHTLHKADMVLVGLSRTSKTPLSTYLAQMGWKVANIPLWPELAPPRELFSIDQAKIYALIIEVEALVRVRRERLRYLGLPPQARYADREKIAREIEWCRSFYRQHPHWPVIDVSGRAIEETAAKIVRLHEVRLGARGTGTWLDRSRRRAATPSDQ